jgi:hypothetical protein
LKHLLLAFAVAACPTKVFAQGMPVVPYAANFAQTHLHNQLFVQPGVNAELRRLNKGKPPIAKPVVQPVAAVSRLSFAPSISRRRENLAGFVRSAKLANMRGGSELESVFADGDIIQKIGESLVPYGLKTNNLADAYAVYWMSMWEASRGIVSSQTSKPQALAVRKQVADALLASEQIVNSSETAKQQLVEALLVDAALVTGYLAQANGDRQLLEKIANMSKANALKAGLDLDAMDLTPNGFVPAKGRKRSDAGGAASDGAGDGAANSDTTLASNDAPNRDNAPSDPLSGPLATYALIAAAGGAGLGGVFLIGKAVGKKG